MATTHTGLTFKRFTRQASTGATAVLAVSAAAAQAETILKTAAWVEQSDTQGTFPARNALQDGFDQKWDAFKHVGNYESGYQRAYAGMVAYRISLPADAAGKNVVSVDIPLYVDRWLVDGVRVAAYLSDDSTPATDWDTLREGGGYLSAQLPMAYTADDPPLRVVVEKNDTLTITFAAPIAAEDYLWVVVSLEDYTTSRDFWIEGAALILGETVAVTFDADVSADTIATPPPADRRVDETICYGVGGILKRNNFRHTIRFSGDIGAHQCFATHPLTSDGSEVYFDGDDGQIVGFGGGTLSTWNDFHSVVMTRIFPLGANDAFAKMRFSSGVVLPMADKEFSAKMIIWAGRIDLADDDTATDIVMARADMSAAGYVQQNMFKGYAGAVTVANRSADRAHTAWTLTKVGEHVLEGRDYTNLDTFDVDIKGPGVTVMMICVSPMRYWADDEVDMPTARATFAPGKYIYLS